VSDDLAAKLLGQNFADQVRVEDSERLETQMEASKWNPADITDALNGLRPPPPQLLKRSDGKSLLYQGKIHWFQGEPGSMKSMLAQHAVQQVLMDPDGGPCLYIDYESEGTDVVGRLIDLGVPRDVIAERFDYVHPEGGTTMSPGDLAAYNRLVSSRPWSLVVLDGTTDSIAFEGLEANSGGDIARWLQAIPRKLQATGATVVVIDHVAKSTEGRGRWAIGSGHKLAGLDGVSFTLEMIVPLAKAVDKPEHTGVAKVVVNKDRGGDVQALCGDDNRTVGMLRITAYQDGTLDARVEDDTTSVAMDVAYEVFVAVGRALKTYPGATGKQVINSTGLSEYEASAGLLQMVERGWVKAEAAGASFKHTLTQAGVREFRDDQPF